MKTAYTLLVASLLVISVLPAVFAVDVGTDIGVDITTEDYIPDIWLCDSRAVADDLVEDDQAENRQGNYAFEGEMISWRVIAHDKNGIEKIEDVFVTLDGDIEANCEFDGVTRFADESCNARILEENAGTSENPFGDNTAAYYNCKLTVETSESHYGEYWATIEVVDLDGLSNSIDESEYWFLNPVISLGIDGDLTFEDVRPGALSYSDPLLVQNLADDGSGVLLSMSISGTDFYDASSSGAKCPATNQLSLDQFAYYATNGAWSTQNAGGPADSEGYLSIPHGDRITDSQRIITGDSYGVPDYGRDQLAPGAEMALTFRLDLPEPCNGDFDTGSIFFWGEAI